MKHRHLLIALTLAATMPLVPCSAEPAFALASTNSSATVADSNYKITAGDLVQVKVFREDDLLTTARVTDDGYIAFPLIGNVRIAGKTDTEAARAIRDLLDARFLVNPSVTLSITGHGKRTFTVLGQVQKPGVYNMTYHDRIDILQAFGMAGGYTRFANSNHIVVKRTINGKESVFSVNATKMAANDGAETFQILPGDTITVPEARF
jgi:polysaccharide export outer membrane protein